MLVLDLVAAFRSEIPGLGTNKLYRLMRLSLDLSEIKMGRDKLHSLLQSHNLVIRPGLKSANNLFKSLDEKVSKLDQRSPSHIN